MYFDSAATSFPKPKEVKKAISNFFEQELGSFQRTDTENSDFIYETRRKLSDFFNVESPSSIVFTSNSTESLNIIIQGFLKNGDHVITTATEHNSVIRPLVKVKHEKNIQITWVKCDKYGFVNPDDIISSIKDNTKLVIMNHGSNVTGQVQDVEQVGQRLQKYDGKIKFLVDISQTAGHIKIDNSKIQADFLAFTGHKALLGVPGIGGFYINPKVDLPPFKVGGTGVLSELLEQPKAVPLKYESGTLNSLGVLSLYHSLDYLNSLTTDKIASDLKKKTCYFLDRLSKMENLEIYSLENPLGIISFNIRGIVPSRISHFLSKDLDLQCRTGLLCAPFIHEFIHNNPFGCVRLSMSYETTWEEINVVCEYLKNINEQAESIQNIKFPEIYEMPSIKNMEEYV
ncbi:aminotransferase class V-fold PLP-dependent enzyme [Streptococcus sp.]|jgi:cysteine desulfurase family protein|uniref:aminotransferase class V-fold PLP-dependent enzyme n=1 Tax=Streptococcus sp. TaxID=1306 RepID=UPI00178FFB98|nr:aminotransferase class V-fold PLP-dependent enzyme [Streptococcus sp.]HHU65183.1 aminotransferase class V-fold PLP-dependent enzyme [Streptococcus sp.]